MSKLIVEKPISSSWTERSMVIKWSSVIHLVNQAQLVKNVGANHVKCQSQSSPGSTFTISASARSLLSLHHLTGQIQF